jgi:hypothetical protein
LRFVSCEIIEHFRSKRQARGEREEEGRVKREKEPQDSLWKSAELSPN